MRWNRHVILGTVVMSLGAGCRTATRIIDEPRVDLETSGGNRGYLIGHPPVSEGSAKTTRQMVETELEVPAFSKATGQPPQPMIGAGKAAPGDETAGMESMPSASTAGSQAVDTYVVKKGDSLWLIAARPEIYGNAGKWRRIYNANRDRLKTPSRIRAGMTLRIPRGESAPSEEHHATHSNESGTVFTK